MVVLNICMQINPYPCELIEFDKLEIIFPFGINKQIACSLELYNYVALDIQDMNAAVLPRAQQRCCASTIQVHLHRKAATTGANAV
jgi:hypothetical protein